MQPDSFSEKVIEFIAKAIVNIIWFIGSIIIKIITFGFKKLEALDESLNNKYAKKKNQDFIGLTDKGKDIRTIYKKASKLCHPDLSANLNKDSDTNKVLFQMLNKAYSENNIEKVRNIYNMLKD